MKKLAFLIFAALCLAALSFGASAAAAPTPFVRVAVAKEGRLACEGAVPLPDTDGDCKLTLRDVLYSAHEEFYIGGAAAGYADADGAVSKLWGTAERTYLFFVNNQPCTDLQREIGKNAFVTVAVLKSGASTAPYAYFDQREASAGEGEDLTLILKSRTASGASAVADATITLDGVPTKHKTDKQGRVQLSMDEVGERLISAELADKSAVPPVCSCRVLATEENPEAQRWLTIGICAAGAAVVGTVFFAVVRKFS